jgi:hypothetical protein
MIKSTTLPFALYCAFRYAAISFGAGVLLGTLRNLVLAPSFGRLPALAIELPIILTICWFASNRLVVKALGVRAPLLDFTLVGALAFATLIFAEYILGKFAMGITLAQLVRHWTTFEGAIGLIAQVLFGLFPLLQRLLVSADRRQSS